VSSPHQIQELFQLDPDENEEMDEDDELLAHDGTQAAEGWMDTVEDVETEDVEMEDVYDI
jgi:hypothetical protein